MRDAGRSGAEVYPAVENVTAESSRPGSETAPPSAPLRAPGYPHAPVSGGPSGGPGPWPAAPTSGPGWPAAPTSGGPGGYPSGPSRVDPSRVDPSRVDPSRVDPSRQETLPPDHPTGPAPDGTPLGSRYVLDEVIGSGATGRVWQGRRRADGAPVAVKVLREEFAKDPDSVVRFLRERNTLRSLDHPHLVRVWDLVAEGDTLAVVMDLISGEDLRRAMRRGAVPPDQAISVLVQVADALAAVHAAGIVHRDIKPENVLLSPASAGPYARLTDFGLARATDGPAVTRMSQLVGTPAYIAPELVAGRDATGAVDVYAMGITAYELLSGRRPFEASNTAALLRAHLDEVPSRPPELSEPMWRLVEACLAKDPEVRPSAAQLAGGLRAATAGDQVTQPVPSFGGPPPAVRPVSLGTPPPSLARPVSETTPPPLLGARPVTETPPPFEPAPAAGGVPPVRPHDPAADLATEPPFEPFATPPARFEQPGQYADPAAALATTGATRPAPVEPAPPAPPKRRRRGLLIGVIAACAVLGSGLGLWIGQPDHPKAAEPSDQKTGTPVRQYELPVTATTPTSGSVRLQFSDASALPGFDSYVIYRDNTLLTQVPAGQAPPYVVANTDKRTQHCYRVAALLVTDAPPPSTANKPACLVADGRTE